MNKELTYLISYLLCSAFARLKLVYLHLHFLHNPQRHITADTQDD